MSVVKLSEDCMEFAGGKMVDRRPSGSMVALRTVGVHPSAQRRDDAAKACDDSPELLLSGADADGWTQNPVDGEKALQLFRFRTTGCVGGLSPGAFSNGRSITRL
jgi:hypothetical protein